MLAAITASEVWPAGISCAETVSFGWAAFQAATICLPQATSCALLEYQMLMGPCALVAAALDGEPPPPPHATVAPSATAAAAASRARDVIVFSLGCERCGGAYEQLAG